MRRALFLFIVLAFGLIVVFGSSSIPNGKAKGKPAAEPQMPGSRCTRLTFGPREKKKPATSVIGGSAMPGTRCARLSSGGRPGTILPNAPTNVGLASSTSYIAGKADTKVNLKAVACDPDGDNILYTYSTTGGRISGDGAEAVWDLGGTQPGVYTVTVEVDDGCGCISFSSSVVTLE